MYKKESNLKNEKFFIYGKHAVFAALANLKRILLAQYQNRPWALNG